MADRFPSLCRPAAYQAPGPAFVGRLFGTAGLLGALAGAWLPFSPQAHAATANTQQAAASALDAKADQREAEDAVSDRAEEARRAVDRMFDEPLAGVVVNRTVTVLGKDFYQYFSTRWRQNPESARYSISIHERPTARFGSEIWVQYRQQRMFHTFLPPARAATRSISEVAVQDVLENVSRRELERLTTHNPDLGPEEF